jgi:hypothetical protein
MQIGLKGVLLIAVAAGLPANGYANPIEEPVHDHRPQEL